MTGRKRGEKGGGEENLVYQSALENISEGVYVTDRHRTITYWNRGAEAITGYSRDDVLGCSCPHHHLAHVDDAGAGLCDEGCPLTIALTEGRTVEVEAYLHHKEGHRLPVHIRTAPIRSATGAIVGACQVFADISSRISTKNKIRQLKKLDRLDPLTNLADRRYMEEALARRLDEAARSGVPVALLFYPIDRFGEVKERLGEKLGDLVIKMVGTTLLKNARALDLIGRWGGEAFMEIIPNVTEETLRKIAERNRMLIEHSELEAGPEKIRVTVSVGATFLKGGETLQSLLARVGALAEESQKGGGNRVAFA